MTFTLPQGKVNYRTLPYDPKKLITLANLRHPNAGNFLFILKSCFLLPASCFLLPLGPLNILLLRYFISKTTPILQVLLYFTLLYFTLPSLPYASTLSSIRSKYYYYYYYYYYSVYYQLDFNFSKSTLYSKSCQGHKVPPSSTSLLLQVKEEHPLTLARMFFLLRLVIGLTLIAAGEHRTLLSAQLLSKMVLSAKHRPIHTHGAPLQHQVPPSIPLMLNAPTAYLVSLV